MGDVQASLKILSEIMLDPHAVTEEKLLACRSVVERILDEESDVPGEQWVEISRRLSATVPTWKKEWRARLNAIDSIHKKRSKTDLVALISIHNALMVMYDDIQGAMENLSS